MVFGEVGGAGLSPYQIGILDLNLRVGRGIDAFELIVVHVIVGPIYRY